jgi:hydrogenase expression/formation protein HypC
MCLALPGRILSIEGDYAMVDINGNTFRVFIQLLPEAQPGDYVLVHAGYALQFVSEAEAQITLDILKEMDEYDPNSV